MLDEARGSRAEKPIRCMQVKESDGAWAYDKALLAPDHRGSEMQYIVEVCVNDRELVASMAEMRTWLDHRRIEPNGFRHCRENARVMFHVDFNSEPDAIGFARAFGGRVVGGPAVAVEEVTV